MNREELREEIARAMSNTEDGADLWDRWPEHVREVYRRYADVALAIVDAAAVHAGARTPVGRQ